MFFRISFSAILSSRKFRSQRSNSVISQNNINFIISQSAVRVSVYDSDLKKVVLGDYNIFIRRRDELDEFKMVYVTVDLLSLSDKKLINIEAKDLNFTIFMNEICRYEYIYFDGARDRLEWEKRERILKLSLSQLP